MRRLSSSAVGAGSVFFTLMMFLFCLIYPGPLLAEEYGSITGTVYEADGTTPVPGLQVYFQPDGCDGESAHGADTDINGHYTITGVPPGAVIVRACADCNNQPYVPVWYDNDTGVRDCEQALDVLVMANVTTDGIDFRLDAGVMISGRITDTQGNPIPDVWIEAFDSLCGYNYLGGGRTDDQGYYTTRAVPPGDIYIRACPECDDHMFRNTWWTAMDSSGSTSCSDAQNLNLAVGVNAVDIDFTLEYPILVEVKRYQRQDDSFDTWYGIYFFDFDNFDLDSVVSITMTGPSGSPIYHYNRGGGDGNDFVKNQWNGFHYNAFGAEPVEGEYIFDVVTDDFSTTVHHVRNENKPMPVVDGGTMTPADGSVTSSRVPIFEWNPVEDHQMSLYYRVQVYDDAGYRVFNSGWQAGLRNIALPEGLLEPGRTYTWSVQVNETDDFRQIENVGASEIFSITMADTVSSGTNPPAIDLDGWGAVHSSRPGYDATLCWIEVIDHDGIAHDGSSHRVTVTFNGETHPLYHVRSDSAFTANYEYWDSNSPAPPGEYVFTVVDPDGNATSLAETLEVNPLPLPDRETFNVTSSGTSPTITWDPVPGAAWYRIRIWDMNWNVVWHGNPLTQTNPAYTVPPGILEPNTAYRYRIRSWEDHYPNNYDNESVSDFHTFTTGEESVNPLIEIMDGASTWTNALTGTYLSFWIKIHDGQGVPDNIKSVTAAFPDGTSIPLYLDYTESATRGIYQGSDHNLPIMPGDYVITVEDLDGNTHSYTDTLDVNPVGYPLDDTISAVVGDTQVDLTWDAVPDALFYRVELYDKDNKQSHVFGTTRNEYTIPEGYLKANTFYRYRITTRKEFFRHGVNNASSSGMGPLKKYFATTPAPGTSPPAIDLDGEGAYVVHFKEPVEGRSKYLLEFVVSVSDPDGVPHNISRVQVTYPDGITTSELLPDGILSPGAVQANYTFYEPFDTLQDIQEGVYSFEVMDHAGLTAGITDTLVVDPISIPVNSLPADGSVVTSTTPIISWHPVPGAGHYKVILFKDWDTRIHEAADLSTSYYEIPDGILQEKGNYSYRIHAYKDGEQENLDNMSVSQLFIGLRPHFLVSDVQTAYTLSHGSQDLSISAGIPAVVYGTAAANEITLEGGAQAELVNFPGSNLIVFESEAAFFKVSRSGTVVTFQGIDGTTLKIPATANEQTIVFNGDPFGRVLRIDGQQVKLDDQVIGTEAAFISEN